jgi:single-strand selective monofunctional uracil DNA glycosylase
MKAFLEDWVRELKQMHFTPPVAHVYNPIDYASEVHLNYWERYGNSSKKLLLLGMNPGPWGMTQTGVPFGEVSLVKDWLQLTGEIRQPSLSHPARPITGWACSRREISGTRLWGCIRQRYPDPQDFFRLGFVASFCPLVFLEQSGLNRTPDKLPKAERQPLIESCQRALLYLVKRQRPQILVGIGKWATQQAIDTQAAFANEFPELRVVSIPHPSPANPATNSGWGSELTQLLHEFDPQ